MPELARPWERGDQDQRWLGYFNEHNLLINLSQPQVTTQAALDAFENAHATVAAIELRLQPIAGKFDLEHLQAIHLSLAGNIYPWAGELRTVDIAKGTRELEGGGTAKAGFLPHQHIATYMGHVATMLQEAGHLRGLESNVFAHRLAHYFNAVNFAHPFREMNGRTSREFWTQLATQAGHTIKWTEISAEENIVISHRARTRGDLEPLREALERVTVPLQQGADRQVGLDAARLARLGYATSPSTSSTPAAPKLSPRPPLQHAQRPQLER